MWKKNAGRTLEDGQLSVMLQLVRIRMNEKRVLIANTCLLYAWWQFKVVIQRKVTIVIVVIRVVEKVKGMKNIIIFTQKKVTFLPFGLSKSTF